MNDVAAHIITCPACGRQLRCKPEFAGKRLKCPCGQIISPETGTPQGPVDPLNYATPGSSDVDRISPEKLRNIQVPLILLGIGFAIQIGSAYWNGARSGTRFRAAMNGLLMGVVIESAIMMFALLIAAYVRRIDLGSWGSSLLKLAALCVAPPAAFVLIHPILRIIPIFGGLVGLGVEFVLYYTLLGFFFDLDESDTNYCILVMIGVAVAVALGEIWLPKWL